MTQRERDRLGVLRKALKKLIKQSQATIAGRGGDWSYIGVGVWMKSCAQNANPAPRSTSRRVIIKYDSSLPISHMLRSKRDPDSSIAGGPSRIGELALYILARSPSRCPRWSVPTF
jgi:hypothetical protein